MSELSSLPSSSSPARDASAQRRQMQQLQQRLETERCNSGLFGLGGSSACPKIRSDIRNLQNATGSAITSNDRTALQQRRARILSALRNYECDNSRRTRDEARRNDGKTLERAALKPQQQQRPTTPRTGKRDDQRERLERQAKAAPVPRSFAGRYRTLCVRTCDGYFFPISGISNRNNFSRDEKNCQSMCPAAEVELYYHDVNDEESQDMVSVASKTPYLSLPSAFDYRLTPNRRPGCTCQPNGEKRPLMTMAPAKPVKRVKNPVPTIFPTERPDRLAAPEILANIDGGLDKRAILRLLSDDEQAANAQIRVVGPVFLPDPKGAINLRAPARNSAR